MDLRARSDDELMRLATREPEAFGLIYERHAAAVLAYLYRRTGSPEAGADLTAEVFAAAFQSRWRYRRRTEPLRAWLFGIANHKLSDSRRRDRLEDRARSRLGVGRVDLEDLELERVADLVNPARDGAIRTMLADLSSAEREAVLGRIVDERDYADLATLLGTSEPAVRKRVSRGLGRLGRAMRENET